MSLAISVTAFYGFALLLLPLFSDLSEVISIAAVSGIAGSGVHIGVVMCVRRYFYTAILFLFHLGLCLFTAYVYLKRDSVVVTTEFVFSTFTDDNLRVALLALVTTVLVVLGTWLVLSRRIGSILEVLPAKALTELIGPLHRVTTAWVVSLALTSALLACVLFLTNPTVLDLPYPQNLLAHWVPNELLRVPTLLALAAVGISYSKYLHQGADYMWFLRATRINSVVTPLLMLVLEGSRALYTFAWLLLGMIELYLLVKRRGSALWFVFLLSLSFFSYAIWPLLRPALSSEPSAELLQLLGFLRLTLLDSTSDATLHIQSFPMIGQSLFHMLYVIQLVQDGFSLSGTTFLNLVPQVLPEFLDGVLWNRPLNDNWKLAEYYYHQGGFLAVANAYWNGGLAIMACFVAITTALFIWLDRYLSRAKTGVLYKAVYWLWLPVMVVQLGYGVQGLARVVELLAATILIDQIHSGRSSRASPAKAAA